ncbi:hypothetical protein CVT26_010230 [Gymnopilus dilepis]|uniref:NACHT domain-containing protein n=1 Tax=Gymnopilus dilepis TaxID=231916 RepID=A0A409Y162_9AGAR|nr:hypothetical protein CVT26_010230 [Gymnopilus dilepis]
MSSDLSLISQSFRDSAIRSGDGSGGGGRGGDIGSYNTNTTNFYVNQNGARRLEALKLLYDHMAHGALYNSSELSNALDWQKDTRQAVIKEIEDWATADDVEPVLWLNGPAGSGKSSIAKRIAEILHDCGKLAGSFFFARLSTSVGRNDTTRLIATIAYQLSVSIPTIREHMADALDLDPNIFEKAIDTQMEDLVIKPLTKARAQMVDSQAVNVQTGSNYPRIIILDGLDECVNATDALKALFSVLKGPNHLLSFFITSRPELSLRTPFWTGRLDGNGGRGGPQIDIRRLVLDSRYDPDADVRAFVNSCFESIKKSHPCQHLIPEDWPSPEDVDWLVGRSSGQFIYAHTVMNYVGSSDYFPPDQLARILPHRQRVDQDIDDQPLADTPFAALDSLYTTIFQAVKNIPSALKIFTFILLRYTAVEAKVELIQRFLGMTKEFVPLILKDLHSILHVPDGPDRSSSASVYLYHASLEDFLLDKGRSGVFFIDRAKGHAQLAIRCAQNIAQAAPALQNDSIAETSLKISCLELMAHCTASACIPELLEALEKLNFEDYLNLAFGGQHDSSVQRDLWRQIGPFYEWIKLHLNAKEGRPEVYAKYLESFDKCLHERLERYQKHQPFEHLISASTLPSFGRYSLNFFRLLFLEISPQLSSLEEYEALDDDGCMLRWLSSSKMSFHHSMVTDFLTDVSRSKDFYVQGENYTKLIDFCITFLNDPRLQSDGDEGKWPQWIMTKDLAEYEDCCLRIISDATKLVSNVPAFLETRNSKGPRGLLIPDNSRYFMDERREIMIRTIRQTLEYSVNVTPDVAPSSRSMQDALKLLYNHTAHGAPHNSSEHSNAGSFHDETRRAVIQEITKWSDAPDNAEQIFWLRGRPGSGKTSIARKVAEILQAQKLAASFFFARMGTSVGRNNDSLLIATIAYQFTLSIPATRQHIVNALTRDPRIFDKGFEIQLDELLVKPLRESKGHHPRFIILDGLDECESPRIRLDALFAALEGSTLPVSFFITTRLDYSLPVSNSITVHQLVLEGDFNPEGDMKAFLRTCLKSIEISHPAGMFLPPDWKSDANIQPLVERASGQFIYASTVMKYVASPDHWPTDRLKEILDLEPRGENPKLAALDAVYRHIISSIEPDRLPKLMQIFAYTMLRKSSFETGIDAIEHFLGFKSGIIASILQDLQPIFHAPPVGSGSDKLLYLSHATLEDFLLDKARSADLAIDRSDGHEMLAMRCLVNVAQKDPDNRLDMSMKISYLELMPHCIEVNSPSTALLDALESFDFEDFLETSFQGKYDVDTRRGICPWLVPFFEWIKHQTRLNKKSTLYSKFIGQFDRFLDGRIKSYQYQGDNDFFEFHFFTAATLTSFADHSLPFFHALSLKTPRPLSSLQEYEKLDDAGCKLRLAASKRMTGYLSMVKEYLEDISRAGKDLHITSSRYKRLGRFCIEFLQDARLSSENPEWPKWFTPADIALSEEACFLLLIDTLKVRPRTAKYLVRPAGGGPNPLPERSNYFSGPERDILAEKVQDYVKEFVETDAWKTKLKAVGDDLEETDVGIFLQSVQLPEKVRRGPHCIVM